jgi:hypothetical protein
LIYPNFARSKHILSVGNLRHGVGPSGIESETRDDFSNLTRLNAVIEVLDLKLYGISIVWLRAIRAPTVTMLRSRGESPGLFQTSSMICGVSSKRSGNCAHVIVGQRRTLNGIMVFVSCALVFVSCA